MSDLVGNPEDRCSHNEAHMTSVPGQATQIEFNQIGSLTLFDLINWFP